MIAAGHNVHIFAPKEQPSALGTTFGGIEQLFGEDEPDLVISGADLGPSTGISANASAALAAAVQSVFDCGIPAIAVSIGADERGQAPEGLYEFGADFTAELVDSLLETAPEDGSILPADRGLNVNIPVGADREDIAFTLLDEATALHIGVERVPVPGNDEFYRFDFAGPVTIDNPLSEGTNFVDGSITITPVDGNHTADLATTLAVADLLDLTFGNPTVFGAGQSDMLFMA